MSTRMVTTLAELPVSVTPSQLLKAFFILSASGILFVAALPLESRRLLTNYGARASPSSPPSSLERTKAPESWDEGRPKDSFTAFISTLTSYGQIPHRWFIHFYLLSVSCSLFWLHQQLSSGPVLRAIASLQARNTGAASSMSLGQVRLVWSMMFLQGSRRLYEDLYVIKPSRSTMWVVHWLLALAFYSGMSLAVWVEGSDSLLAQAKPSTAPAPSITIMPKVILGGFVFLCGSFMQYRCHKHLASLKKYSLPSDGIFRVIVCPHYTCECLLYLGMSVAGAPPGSVLNKTLLCALVFVLANLGVTANGTKRWYEDKFGENAVVGKWRMVPWVF